MTPRPVWELTPDEFKRTFTPLAGADYGWVLQLARDEYSRAVEAFRLVDGKAATVGNYLAAGAGLLTFGAVAAVADGRIDRWVVLAAVPSLLLALAALVVSVVARISIVRPSVPPITYAVGYAEFDPQQGQAAFLGVWHVLIEGLHRVIPRKQKLVDWSLRLFAAAVVTLMIPLAVGLGQRFCP